VEFGCVLLLLDRLWCLRVLVWDWPVVLSVLVPLGLVVSDGIDEFGAALVSGGGVVVLWSAGVSDEGGGIVD